MTLSPDAELILTLLDEAPAEGLAASELLMQLARRGLHISQPTLSRRLRELREAEHIVQQGSRRGARYARDAIALHFSQPAEQRRPVNYNFNLIEDYVPNQNYWLSTAQRARLRTAGEQIRALPPAQGSTVLERLSIDLSWASSHLEGNTYSLLDTEQLIVQGREAAGKSLQETRMILNHKQALDYLRAHAQEFGPYPRDIYELHALLSAGLLADETNAGRVRRGLIEITGTAYLPITPPQQLEEQLALILEKARAITDPFEQSVFLLAFIPYLQPFIDVNKRVGRLAANIPLLKSNVCPISYRDMDKDRYIQGLLAFYELNRVEPLARAYCEAYERGAVRYAAIIEQGRQVHPLEIQHYRELKQCVADHVAAVAASDGADHPAAFARTCFANLPQPDRDWLAERVAQIVTSLHEGNSIAWGVDRTTWERYHNRIAAPPR